MKSRKITNVGLGARPAVTVRNGSVRVPVSVTPLFLSAEADAGWM